MKTFKERLEASNPHLTSQEASDRVELAKSRAQEEIAKMDVRIAEKNVSLSEELNSQHEPFLLSNIVDIQDDIALLKRKRERMEHTYATLFEAYPH